MLFISMIAEQTIDAKCLDIVRELNEDGRYFITVDLVIYILLQRYRVHDIAHLGIGTPFDIPILASLSHIHRKVRVQPQITQTVRDQILIISLHPLR